jgi:hypothetical protein
VTDKKVDLLLFIPSTKYFKLVEEKNVRNKMKKEKNILPRYTITASEYNKR